MAGNYADLGLAYSQRVRSAGSQRDASLASNAYGRFLSQQRGRRQQADLTRASNNQLGKLAASYGVRGLRNSGVRQRGVSDFATGVQQQSQDIADRVRQEQQQSVLDDASVSAAYEQLVADAELQKMRDIYATALSLQDYMPFLGS